MNADQIRKNLIEKRKALSPDFISSSSAEIVSKFLKKSRFDRYPLKFHVGLYFAEKGELNLYSLDQAFRQQGSKVLYPRLTQDKSRMEFVEIDDFENESLWEKGAYGIKQPRSHLKEMSPDLLDLIFVPGVAFGESFERIGRGAGYYDRYLPCARQAMRIALTWDFQILPSLPQSSTDEAMHWMMTEKRELRSPFVQAWMEKRQLW